MAVPLGGGTVPSAANQTTKDVTAIVDNKGNKLLLMAVGLPIVVWLGGTSLGPFVNLTLVAVLAGLLMGNIAGSANASTKG